MKILELIDYLNRFSNTQRLEIVVVPYKGEYHIGLYDNDDAEVYVVGPSINEYPEHLTRNYNRTTETIDRAI